MADTVERTIFTTSRLMEFFSEKELSLQIGHPQHLWPAAILKELIDNALDACESTATAPSVTVQIGDDLMTVRDNGPGIPPGVIETSLDYTVRVSTKSYYVSPTRGQLGNAFKCVWAAAFVVDGQEGRTEVESHGVLHRIDVTLDRIAQAPRIEHRAEPTDVKSGTRVTVHWREVASYLDPREEDDYYNARDLVAAYAAFNPHARFTLTLPDAGPEAFEPSSPSWPKWRTRQATPPHWYGDDKFRDLIAAHIAEEARDGRPLTVREFVKQFHGLSGSAKQKAVCQAAGLTGSSLRDLVRGGDVDVGAADQLLAAMREASRAVKPKALGELGEGHVAECLVRDHDVGRDSIRYKKLSGEADQLPYVLEVAFGVSNDSVAGRNVLVGLNWSPAITIPFADLHHLLGEMRADAGDPVVLFVHLAYPMPVYTDRGKSRLSLPPSLQGALAKCVRIVARGWKKAKNRAERVSERDLAVLRQTPRQKVAIKDAAARVMEEAYLHASANGRLPANARQVMYAARPLVLRLTGGRCWSKSSTFTQHYLPDYLKENPETTGGWDVVFDARGQFTEPHTGRGVNLGTLSVRDYVRSWSESPEGSGGRLHLDYRCPTSGPTHRYKFALFVEKEGFAPLLSRAEVAARYDLAVMSTKGMSVTAARVLVERLSEEGVTVLALRDFDKSGFSIVHTLRADTRRYEFASRPNVIDLGLRLQDVRALGLQAEAVEYRGGKDPRINLRASGAAEEECSFLVRRGGGKVWFGERVELNAMTSSQFISFVERKLNEAGAKKVVPPADVLKQAYRAASRRRLVMEAARQAAEQAAAVTIDCPNDLESMVRRAVEGKAQSWDAAVWELVRGPRERGDA